MPSLSEGAEEFESLVASGQSLLEGGDLAASVGIAHQRWMEEVRRWLAARAPGYGYSASWLTTGTTPLLTGDGYDDSQKAWRSHRMIVESQLSWLARTAPLVLRPVPKKGSIWTVIHPTIREVAQAKFDDGHFADAVESAFKEVNVVVKAIALEAIGRELDGAALMTTTFSLENPLLHLDDLTTISGRDVQKGYMQIFAGSMTGIRNPKAHSNIVISPERALYLLVLSSLLMWKVEEAVRRRPPGAAEKSSTNGA